MDVQGLPLALAGIVGAATAVIHGVLTQKMIVRPIDGVLRERPGLPGILQRLVPPLLHVSTLAWLSGGVALVIAAYAGTPEVRLAVGALVGIQYVFAALANGWASRWRHPGWMLMALSVMLIAYALAA